MELCRLAFWSSFSRGCPQGWCSVLLFWLPVGSNDFVHVFVWYVCVVCCICVCLCGYVHKCPVYVCVVMCKSVQCMFVWLYAQVSVSVQMHVEAGGWLGVLSSVALPMIFF